ncbi:MAG: phosphatase PAP2 family protein [Candidatus Daviesbacteria bacterium]|nr:phosphatase PAP2 family protein [Candidatus Daviesbacteria bacterium]
MDINTAIFFQIYNLSQKNPILDALMIFGADYLIYIVCLIILIFAITGKSKDKKAFILSILGIGIALILTQIIRIFFQLDRPFITYSITPLISMNSSFNTFLGKILGPESFPSVHTLIISVITFSYIYFKSKLAPFFIFSLVWIAFSRIYVGVHYPLDILGGILLGLLSVFLTVFLTLQLKKLLHV